MILTGENLNAGRKTLYIVGGIWMNNYGALNDTHRGKLKYWHENGALVE
jgi:hypothetical protein